MYVWLVFDTVRGNMVTICESPEVAAGWIKNREMLPGAEYYTTAQRVMQTSDIPSDCR